MCFSWIPFLEFICASNAQGRRSLPVAQVVEQGARDAKVMGWFPENVHIHIMYNVLD